MFKRVLSFTLILLIVSLAGCSNTTPCIFSREWDYNTAYHFHSCLNEDCLKVDARALHTYTSQTTDGNCTTKSKITYTCSVCGYSYTEETTYKHTYTESVIAPTCEAEGYTLHTCTGCGVTYKDNYISGHEFGTDDICDLCGATRTIFDGCKTAYISTNNNVVLTSMRGTNFKYETFNSTTAALPQINNTVIDADNYYNYNPETGLLKIYSKHAHSGTNTTEHEAITAYFVKTDLTAEFAYSYCDNYYIFIENGAAKRSQTVPSTLVNSAPFTGSILNQKITINYDTNYYTEITCTDTTINNKIYYYYLTTYGGKRYLNTYIVLNNLLKINEQNKFFTKTETDEHGCNMVTDYYLTNNNEAVCLLVENSTSSAGECAQLRSYKSKMEYTEVDGTINIYNVETWNNSIENTNTPIRYLYSYNSQKGYVTIYSYNSTTMTGIVSYFVYSNNSFDIYDQSKNNNSPKVLADGKLEGETLTSKDGKTTLTFSNTSITRNTLTISIKNNQELK